MRLIVTKTKFKSVLSDFEIIHAPLVKIQSLNNSESIESEWVVFTSLNAVENFIPKSEKIACLPSCIEGLKINGIKPDLVFDFATSDFIAEKILELAKCSTVTYIGAADSSLNLEKLNNNPNFKRVIAYQTVTNNELDFIPENDLIVFWSGSAVKAAQDLGWDLTKNKIFSCSESANKVLKNNYYQLKSYDLEEISAEISVLLRV